MKSESRTLQAKVEELERAEILQALEECGWVKARAARILGITERMVGYKIKKYGLEKEVQEQAGQHKSARYETSGSNE
jgi:Nif-specific regulatory protein